MQLGGAQRVMAQLCRHLVDAGHDTTLITLESSAAAPFFSLPDGLAVRQLGRASEAATGLGRAWRVACWVRDLRRALKDLQPDVIISFIDLTNVMVLAAARGLGCPVIASERTDPHHHAIGRTGSMLRRLTYPTAARIVVQTSRAAEFFDAPLASRVAIIPNPVSPAARHATSDAPAADGRWRITSLGRFSPEKGFDLLIDAFARIAPEFPAWDVLLHGEGPERDRLQATIASLGLADRIRLLRPVRDVGVTLGQTHVFALPSRYEGFPNALGEAMAAGLPCIAFRGVSGVEDLIEHDACGVLADHAASRDETVASLAAALSRLLREPETRVRFGTAARQRVKDFAPASVLARWDALLESVVREGKGRRRR